MAKAVNPGEYKQKRNDILEVYGQLIAEQGIENVSASKVAQAANISKTMIFYYFETTQSMLHALAENILDECTAESLPPIDFTNKDYRQEFNSYVDHVLSSSSQIDLKLFFTLKSLTHRDEIIGRLFENHDEVSIQGLRQALKYFSDHQVIRLDQFETAVKYFQFMISSVQNQIDSDGVDHLDEDLRLLLKRQIFQYCGLEGELC